MFELVEFFLLVVVQDLADLFVLAVPPDGPTRRSPGQPDRAFLPWNNWVAAHYYYPDSVRPCIQERESRSLPEPPTPPLQSRSFGDPATIEYEKMPDHRRLCSTYYFQDSSPPP